MTTKKGLTFGMKWVLAGMLISITAFAEPYIEAGSFYTNDRVWINIDGRRIEESGIIGHIAAGYKIQYENSVLDFQARHESDAKESNKDLTYKNAIGVSWRYKF